MEQLLSSIAQAMMVWIVGLANQNDKYKEVVLIQNLNFLAAASQTFPTVAAVQCLASFVAIVEQGRLEAEERYVTWMVAYEFPTLSLLTKRMAGISARVRGEELALYIRR